MWTYGTKYPKRVAGTARAQITYLCGEFVDGTTFLINAKATFKLYYLVPCSSSFPP